MSRSSELVTRSAEALEEALDARFIREVSTDRISEQAYANYLEIEEAFVEHACRLHGLAAWHAPSWEAVTRHGRALHALTTEQSDYFAAARASWPVSSNMDERSRVQAAALAHFTHQAAAAGGYPAIVTVMFAAEYLYLTWCTRAHADGFVSAGPVADWVALHARAPFTEGVKALASEVDELPAEAPDDQLHTWFEGILRAEIVFHDAVYLPSCHAGEGEPLDGRREA